MVHKKLTKTFQRNQKIVQELIHFKRSCVEF